MRNTNDPFHPILRQDDNRRRSKIDTLSTATLYFEHVKEEIERKEAVESDSLFRWLPFYSMARFFGKHFPTFSLERANSQSTKYCLLASFCFRLPLTIGFFLKYEVTIEVGDLRAPRPRFLSPKLGT
jgi:hypothetical protein